MLHFQTKCLSVMLYIHWVLSLFGLVLRSVVSLSETAVTHRPQGVIIVGIYMSSTWSSNIYYYYYHRQ